jgi:two-component system, OmpR family, aerobic respiration control sensor histidine kinase ArcB
MKDSSHQNSEMATLHNLTDLLIQKYCNILSKTKKNLTIEETVNHIVDYYEGIIASMPGNVYWLDINGIGVGCNNNVLKMFGFKSLQEFKGLTFEEMGKAGKWTPEATQSFKNDTLAVVRTGKPKLNVEEPPIPHADGRMIYFLTSRVPLIDNQGNIVGVVGISIDITDRKRVEQLEKELAEEKIQHLRVLGGIIAHGLRTPLACVALNESLIDNHLTNAAKNIFKNHPEFYDAQIADDFAQIMQYKQEINKVIKKANSTITLMLHNIQEENIDTSKFKNSAIDQDVQLTLQNYPFFDGEKPKVHYQSANTFMYFGDTNLTQLIITNLIKNALTHIELAKKGEIFISYNSDANKNYLIFKDTGPGIPNEFLPKVFNRFASNRKGGTGLGLAFCKMIMQIYGGDIDCQSVEGEYTTFTLSFPK